ncbi:hypothetical protein [Pseudooceanicola marinus]|uniref:hypothetical protein n=1 Tax=Pseudooceanicola marinus TaxID=396013 RepID=UPI001CD5A594|nr:hypothetical protein [Pseudooceanicola marinus]MCA1337408.1 hypothetical protein [Pseudooceanicola marinus]
MSVFEFEDIVETLGVDREALKQRQLPLGAFWHQGSWKIWVPHEVGKYMLLAGGEPVHFTYLSDAGAASEEDLHFQLLEFAYQKFTRPRTWSFVTSIQDDIHLLAVQASKLSYFASKQAEIDSSLLASYARSEIEGLLVTARSAIDLTYEAFCSFWTQEVTLLDEAMQSRKLQNKLPKKISKFLRLDAQEAPHIDGICEKYVLAPRAVAAILARRPFLLELRTARDRIVHGRGDPDLIFATERGFAVPAHAKLCATFNWRPFQRYNEHLFSLKPWVGYVVHETIATCTDILMACGAGIELGPNLFPNHNVFVRDPANPALDDLLQSVSADASIAQSAAFWCNNP